MTHSVIDCKKVSNNVNSFSNVSFFYEYFFLNTFLDVLKSTKMTRAGS